MSVIEGDVMLPAFSSPDADALLPPAPAGDVTVTCDECGQEFVGPAGGRGSAPMMLGRHRWSVHKISKSGKGGGKSRPAVDSTQTIESRHPVVSAVAEAGSAVKGTGTPRAPQLSSAIGKGLSIASLMAAGWAVDSDPLIRAAALDPHTAEEAAQRKTALTNLMAISEEAAGRIAAPIGRLLAPTALNQKYGRALVDNTDLGPAVAELVDVGRAWAQFLAIRRQHVLDVRAARETAAPAPYIAPTPAAQAAAATAAGPGAGTVDPLGGGRVATPTYRTA